MARHDAGLASAGNIVDFGEPVVSREPPRRIYVTSSQHDEAKNLSHLDFLDVPDVGGIASHGHDALLEMPWREPRGQLSSGYRSVSSIKLFWEEFRDPHPHDAQDATETLTQTKENIKNQEESS